MTQLAGPTAFYDLAKIILAATKADLATGPSPVPPRVGVVPGQIAWDSCTGEDCGQLAISLVQTFLCDDFPIAAGTSPQANCAAASIVGWFTMQLIRCAPMGTGAAPPTVPAQDAAAAVVMMDAEVLVQAVSCQLEDLKSSNQIWDYLVLLQMVVGPEGGCVGNQIDFQVQFSR